MTRVSFVATPDDAPSPEPETRVVVLDSAWTPAPADRPDLVPVRPMFDDAIESRDLFEEALARLDRWADAGRLADRLLIDGVTYWFRMREQLWHWLHERLLWLYALRSGLPDLDGISCSASADEVALIDVLRALGAEVAVQDADANGRQAPTRPLAAVDRLRSLFGGRRRPPATSAPSEAEQRRTILAERVRRLSDGNERPVLLLTTPAIYQRIGATAGGARRDPHLASVIDALESDGQTTVLLGLGLDERRDEDWAAIAGDDRLLPYTMLRTRWSEATDEQRVTEILAGLDATLTAEPPVPMAVEGVDLGPDLVRALGTALAQVAAIDVRQLARIERLLAEVRPAAVVLAQEGVRTAWLTAGARAGVPVFAVQHGVLYPSHPGYARVRHARLMLPTVTFVYGDYERGVLTSGAYDDREVEVSGAPRLDLADAAAATSTADERAAVRSELGVAEGNRLVVVSTLHLPFVRRSHLVHMIERVLGGRLPGVHVVFKQHPGEREDGPYRELLTGLARAGGYDRPPVTIVRDVDLYRLLRAADAHVGLHSTVLTDAVAAGTPNFVAIVEPHADLLGYVDAGVARPVRSREDLLAAFADPRPTSPEARRAFLEQHFRPGRAGERIAASIRARIDQRSTVPA